MPTPTTSRARETHLEQTEAQLTAFRAIGSFSPPRRGWIRAIRTALGMRGNQLAGRLGVTPGTLSLLEAREAEGGVTLDTLARAAAALDCELVYALVPKTSLREMRTRRANEVASRTVADADHTMRLEAQSASEASSVRLAEQLADEMLRDWSSRIWDRPSATK